MTNLFEIICLLDETGDFDMVGKTGMKNLEMIFKTFQKLSDYRNVMSYSSYDLKTYISKTEALEKQLLQPTCKIVVAGEFKRGKSSFINALLGETILPESVSPWTAVQTEIYYSETEQIEIWEKSGVKKQIERSQLEKWLTKSAEQDEKAERAKIGYPASFLLDNAVSVIDTPGLNDQDNFEQKIYETVCNTDILIWILSHSSPFSNTELNYVQKLIQTSAIRHVFFVMNKIDVLEKEDVEILLETVRQRINEIPEDTMGLEKLLFHGKVPVFGFSALNALKARKQKDCELLWQSGLPQIQNELEKLIYDTCYEKQTEGILDEIYEHVEKEIKRYNDNIQYLSDQIEILDQSINELDNIINFFGTDFDEYAKIIAENYKQKLHSLIFQLQHQFRQSIYSKSYEILSICCKSANEFGNDQGKVFISEIAVELWSVYVNQRNCFLGTFIQIIEKLENIEKKDGLWKNHEISIEKYLPKFDFMVIDFPGLLIKRDPLTRETYLDRIVEQVTNAVSDKWEKGLNTWAVNITKQMNEESNDLIVQKKNQWINKKQQYEEKMNSMLEEKFYKDLLILIADLKELKREKGEEILL